MRRTLDERSAGHRTALYAVPTEHEERALYEVEGAVSCGGDRTQVKRDWRERRFPTVPGDEVEFVPLPDF